MQSRAWDGLPLAQNAWQGVALLPFVDEKRLLAAVTPLYDKLTEEERLRNESGNDLLFVSNASKLFETICDIYGSVRNRPPATRRRGSD